MNPTPTTTPDTRRLEQQTNLLTALAADIRDQAAQLEEQHVLGYVVDLLRAIAGRIDLALDQSDQEPTGWPEVVHPAEPPAAEHQTRQEPEPARCSWCMALATGTARSRIPGPRYPSCGAFRHGTTYVAEGDPVVDQEPAR